MVTDPIHEAIRARKRDAEDKRREADLLDAEVRGMEQVLRLIEASPEASPFAGRELVNAMASAIEAHAEAESLRSGGRQPGAISKRWRVALLELRRQHGAFSADDVVAVVHRLEGRSMRPSEVRRLFEGYIDHGYVRSVGSRHYEVPEEAAA